MTHCACRSRVRVGHQTATGPATPTRSHERWGRVEAPRTALGEALVMHRRTRVRFPPPPPPTTTPVVTRAPVGSPTGALVRHDARPLSRPDQSVLADGRDATRFSGWSRRPLPPLLPGARVCRSWPAG